jgi:hypothetical protein
MKYLFVYFLLFTTLVTISQPNLNKTYVIGQNVTLSPCDAVGTASGAAAQIINRGFEFRVDVVRTNDLVIHFLKWTNDAAKNTAYFNSVAPAKSPSIYFILPLSEFAKAVEKHPKAPFALGIAVIPIKMRFGGGSANNNDKRHFSFESSVSLGFSVGINVKLDKSKFTARNNIAFLTGISLTSVPLDNFTTKGFLKSSTNNASITGHIGILYQIDNFQIGIFSGIDYLAGRIGEEWKYRNKPWIGLGIGFSIFQAKKTTDTQ